MAKKSTAFSVRCDEFVQSLIATAEKIYREERGYPKGRKVMKSHLLIELLQAYIEGAQDEDE